MSKNVKELEALLNEAKAQEELDKILESLESETAAEILQSEENNYEDNDEVKENGDNDVFNAVGNKEIDIDLDNVNYFGESKGKDENQMNKLKKLNEELGTNDAPEAVKPGNPDEQSFSLNNDEVVKVDKSDDVEQVIIENKEDKDVEAADKAMKDPKFLKLAKKHEDDVESKKHLKGKEYADAEIKSMKESTGEIAGINHAPESVKPGNPDDKSFEATNDEVVKVDKSDDVEQVLIENLSDFELYKLLEKYGFDTDSENLKTLREDYKTVVEFEDLNEDRLVPEDFYKKSVDPDFDPNHKEELEDKLEDLEDAKTPELDVVSDDMLDTIGESFDNILDLLNEEEAGVNFAPDAVKEGPSDEEAFEAENDEVVDDLEKADDVEQVVIESLNDFELYKILEECGYEPSKENLENLKTYETINEALGGYAFNPFSRVSRKTAKYERQAGKEVKQLKKSEKRRIQDEKISDNKNKIDAKNSESVKNYKKEQEDKYSGAAKIQKENAKAQKKLDKKNKKEAEAQKIKDKLINASLINDYNLYQLLEFTGYKTSEKNLVSLKESNDLFVKLLEELGTNDAPEAVKLGDAIEKAFEAENDEVVDDLEKADDVEQVVIENVSDFELYKVLEECGYAPSKENVEIIREDYETLEESLKSKIKGLLGDKAAKQHNSNLKELKKEYKALKKDMKSDKELKKYEEDEIKLAEKNTGKLEKINAIKESVEDDIEKLEEKIENLEDKVEDLEKEDSKEEVVVQESVTEVGEEIINNDTGKECACETPTDKDDNECPCEPAGDQGVEKIEQESKTSEAVPYDEAVPYSAPKVDYDEAKPYSSFEEAVALGYGYFNHSEDRVEKLTEQVALSLAEANEDKLFEEYVKVLGNANRLFNAIQEKYVDVANDNVNTLLKEMEELGTNDAPDAVKEGEPQEKAFEADNEDLIDPEKADDVEQALIEGFSDELIMEFLSESNDFEANETNLTLIKKALNEEVVIDDFILEALNEKKVQKIKEKIGSLEVKKQKESDMVKQDKIQEKIKKLENKLVKMGKDLTEVPADHSKIMKEETEGEAGVNFAPDAVKEGKPDEESFEADNKDLVDPEKADDVEQTVIESATPKRIAKTPSEKNFK